ASAPAPTRGRRITSLRVRFSVAAVHGGRSRTLTSLRGARTSSNRGSRDSETVVGVFELWRNTRPRRSAGNLYVVPPGATSRGSADSVDTPLRGSFGRATGTVCV